MAIGAVVELCMWYDSGGFIYGLFMRCSDLPLHTMTVRQARPSKCHITSLIALYSEVCVHVYTGVTRTFCTYEYSKLQNNV